MKKLLALSFIISMLLYQVCCAFQPDSDRWEYLGDNGGKNGKLESWADKRKIFFYKENNDTYADIWTLTYLETESGKKLKDIEKIFLYNEVINLDKKEYKLAATVFYNKVFNAVELEENNEQFKELPKGLDKQFAMVYELYNSINKRPDHDKIFAELKTKAENTKITDVYDGKKLEKVIHIDASEGTGSNPYLDFKYIIANIDSNRWQLAGLSDEHAAWLDKKKIYFYKEGNNTYADMWTLLALKDKRDNKNMVFLQNNKINLDTKEDKPLIINMYNDDGSVLKRYTIESEFKKIPSGSLAEDEFSVIYELYNSINKRPDRDKIFAELKSEADNTEIFDPLHPQKEAKPSKISDIGSFAPAESKTNSSESSVDSTFLVGGAVILLLGSIYFFYNRKKGGRQQNKVVQTEDKGIHTFTDNIGNKETLTNEEFCNNPANDNGTSVDKKAGEPNGKSITINDLPKLKELLDEGIITQEEFDKAKKDVLKL